MESDKEGTLFIKENDKSSVRKVSISKYSEAARVVNTFNAQPKNEAPKRHTEKHIVEYHEYLIIELYVFEPFRLARNLAEG